MNRAHCSRCVIAAIAAGGCTIDNYMARYLLRSRLGKEIPVRCIIRDGPIRPVWDGKDIYYIPYRIGRREYEAAAGAWYDAIRKEEKTGA